MDQDVFAQVFWFEASNSAKAFETGANRHRFVLGTNQKSEQNSRESTPQQFLRFEDEPALKDPSEGWLFGSSPQTSDITICLPRTRGVSRRHFSLSVTPDFRVQFHLQSSQRTKVVYHSTTSTSHEICPQRGDKFFVSLAPSEPKYWDHVEVVVGFRAQGVHFHIFFPNHTRNATPEYCKNLQRWVQMKASAVPPVTGLGLDSAISTIAPSRQSPEPPQFGSLCYRRTIGRGSFGIVELLVDLTTGDRAARKTLLKFDNHNTSSERGRITADFWNEARLMQQNPHPYIIKLLALQNDPYPSFVMPYYPHGNMYNMSLSQSQYRSAFRQLLIVLDYLHDRNVAHRDLKPENILVDRLSPIHIIVTDFGLSKEAIPGELMTTFCGTKLYSAPDVFPSQRRAQEVHGYWMSVDIWSAGIIMLEWTYGRPSTQTDCSLSLTEWIDFWSNAVITAVLKHDQENPNDPVIGILKNMLVLDPKERYQAFECLQRGCTAGLFRRTRAGDVIDADDDDPDDNGSNTPKPQMNHQVPEGPADGVLTYKTIPTEIATELTDQIESREPPEDRCSHEDSPRSRSNGQQSTWERFMAFDPIPSYELAPAPIDTVESSPGAEEFLSAEEELSSPREYVPPGEDLGESPRYIPETSERPLQAGTKRPRNTTPSMPLPSMSSSVKESAPPKKKRPANVGYNSDVWADVMGSQPRLAGVPSNLTSGLPASMSLIDFPQEGIPATDAPTVTSS